MRKYLPLATVALLAVPLASCGQPADSAPRPPAAATEADDASSLGDWIGRNADLVTNLGTTLEDMSTAAGNSDVLGLGRACFHLGILSGQALDDLPPAGPFRDAYRVTFVAYEEAADICVKATADTDVDLLAEFAARLTEANDLLAEATRQLDLATQ